MSPQPNAALTDDPTAVVLAAALGAQYEVRALLGRGGMGTVYLARETFLERDVAVKVLPTELASGDARERFLREARTAARLSHPNIVPLHTFGQSGDALYYVMGFVDGESLETRLKREGRLTADAARHITRELADALEYAHQLGVVHRDVKPDNVLLDRQSGRAMLTDFGIAKQHATEGLTQTGVIVGTPHYMSPEQASGERDLDGRTDIYALGVIAYRMVTGRLPFEGSALREVLAQHATRAPIPPAQIIPSLPLDLATVITRALAKDPADRWPTGGSMRDALSPGSDDSVPEELRTITGVGVEMGIVSLGLGELAFLGGIYGFLSRGEVVGVAAVALGVSALAPWNAIDAARKYGWRATLQAWMRQPTWWRSWWPRSLRRAGDVWDRLPIEVRRVRALNLAALPAGLVLMNFLLFTSRLSFLVEHPAFLVRKYTAWPLLVLGGIVFATLAVTLRSFQRLMLRTKVPKADQLRLMREPVAGSSFWVRPHIAALLSPSSTGAGLDQRGSGLPRELVAQIAAAAREAGASPHADLYKEAEDAAAALASAIAHVDRELAALARGNDPKERARVQASQDALGPPSSNEQPATRQMRELLHQQLRLYGDLSARQGDYMARRERLVTQLRTLALHLAHLRAQNAIDSATSSEITDRIRAVCRAVDHRIGAIEETRAALGPR